MGEISRMGTMTGAGKRYKKAAYKLEKMRARAAIADIRGAIEFRGTEDPREQANLRQGAFARGLGKSTIEQQDRARLTDIQARRMAALRRGEDIAVKGLALIKKRRKAQREQQYWDMADAAASAIIGGFTGGAVRPQSGTQVQGSASGTQWQYAAGGMAGGYAPAAATSGY